MRPASATDRPAKGMLVEQVEPNSPATRAKFKQGDIITALDGMPIGTARNLALAIADHCCGPTVTLSVWRGQHGRVIKLPPSLASSA
jgi:S1-C subfamily serine protease